MERFEHTAAKPKGLHAPEDAYQESMRGDRRILKNPSTDQKKVRRAQQRKEGSVFPTNPESFSDRLYDDCKDCDGKGSNYFGTCRSCGGSGEKRTAALDLDPVERGILAWLQTRAAKTVCRGCHQPMLAPKGEDFPYCPSCSKSDESWKSVKDATAALDDDGKNCRVCGERVLSSTGKCSECGTQNHFQDKYATKFEGHMSAVARRARQVTSTFEENN